MVRKIFIGCLFLLGTFCIHAEKVATLEDVLNPVSIIVDKDRMFIVEKSGAPLYAYSLKDYKRVAKFGKKGDGPEEMTVNPFGTPMVIIPYPEYLLINSNLKISYFSRDGEFIKEIKVPPFMVFGEFNNLFIATGTFYKKNQFYLAVSLYSKELKKLKDLYLSDITVGPNASFIYPASPLEYAVYNSRVYIVRGKDDFIIDVFDEAGNKSDTIKKDYPRQKITTDYKKKVMRALMIDPFYKRFWEQIKPLIKFEAYFPVTQRMDVVDGKIYIITYKRQGNLTECIVLDIKGNELKKIFLPVPEVSVLNPFHLFGFQDDRFYYLVENETDETWELHVEKIK